MYEIILRNKILNNNSKIHFYGVNYMTKINVENIIEKEVITQIYKLVFNMIKLLYFYLNIKIFI